MSSKTKVIVDHVGPDVIRIIMREYYEDQWHEFSRLVPKDFNKLTQDEKTELEEAATRFHTENKEAILKEREDRSSLEDVMQQEIYGRQNRVSED